MKRFSWLVLTALWAVPSHAQWKYPPTRAVEASDTYFGTTYQDPYRWLENLHDPATAAWFKAQATLTDSLLASIPGRDALAREWMALDKLSPARFSGISFEGGRVFYKKTLGGENVGKLYYREGWSGSEKLLLDPSAYKQGVATVIESMIPSFDGRHVVVALSANGAEVSELRVIDVDRGTLLSDRIDSSLGPMSWAPDNVSFFYDSGPKSDPQQLAFHLDRKVRMHRLNAAGGVDNRDSTADVDVDVLSDQSHPELKILAKESPALSIDEASPDYVWGGAGTAQQELRAFYAATSDLKGDTLHWKPLCEPSDSLVGNILFDGAQAYAMTHTGAPRFQVIRASLANPDWSHAAIVVPQGPDPIRYITRSRDFMYIVYSNGVTGHVVQYAFKTGKSSDVRLPASGSVDLTCPDARSNRCIVSITSWIRPTTLYDFDADAGTRRQEHLQQRRRLSGLREPGDRGSRSPGSRRHADSALDHPRARNETGRLSQLHPRGLRLLRHQPDTALFDPDIDRFTRRGARDRARARRRRKGRGVACRRLQGHQAEYLARFHFLR